ncbi:hypothetical protein [Salinimicrobium oceani]|uniref:Uncharacterized protein n=1 Tax=Salinimicrobium oceani TaxID=2722702 RepID=A0ABX1D1S5_9FLAO|nr:hypothetical protein [Salinimicrobium oceani]NJW52496.1 hypothetical protein [Salinimicrobium oceani]
MAIDITSNGGSERNTVIYVTVDTKKINDHNIDQHVVFSDNREDPPQAPGRPQDYVSTIDKGMKVYWRGVVKDADSEDTIEITDVVAKDNRGKWKLLDKVESEQGNKGVKVGKVKNEMIRGEEPYSVKFRINGSSGKEYLVDPKLKMAD